jgi:integrase
MPRRSAGARLWLRPESRNTDRSLRARAVWVIKDSGDWISTGCPAEDFEGAQRALADHLAAKYRPHAGKRSPDQVPVADVLLMYVREVAPHRARETEIKQRVAALDAWWGERMLSDVTGRSCREYVKHRTSQAWKSSKPDRTGNAPRMVSEASARRELEDFRAAINYHRREGLCSEIVSVTLPSKPLPRSAWLTRSEAAKLIWAAWRARQVMRNGVTPRAVGKHLARFILVALYTGSRSEAICSAALMPSVGRSWVDLDAGVFHRLAIGRRASKKRQPPVRLADEILAHMRRWRDRGIAVNAIVEWCGKPIAKVRNSFAAAVEASGVRQMVSARLGQEVEITPHVLRHTAATWLMQNGVDVWEAAGFLGMTSKQLEETYGHHHPSFQQNAATGISGRSRAPDVHRNAMNKQAFAATNGQKNQGKSR